MKINGDEAVYVGDTVKDIEAARAAGVRSIAALWGSPEREALEAGNDRSIASPSELRAMLL